MRRIRLGGESILLEASYAVDRMDVITVGDTSWVQMMGIRLIVSDLHLRYCGGGKTLLPMLLEKGTTDCCLLINNHKSDKTLINATP
jgi:hypothetical protein